MSIRLIVDAIPQIVWIGSSDGNLEYCNQAWLDLTGLALEESLGRGWEAAVHPDDLKKCDIRKLKAVRAGTVFETEIRLRRASDGIYRWHLYRAQALMDETGAIFRWIGSCTDIDDQKFAQHAMREDVERQVKERTAELLTTNMQLLGAISERRQAAAVHEQDTQRLNDIIATQALLAQTGLNLQAYLNLAAQKIHRLTGATGTVVELVEGTDLVSAAAAGSTVPFVGFRMSIASSLSGLCIRTRQVLKCDNALDDPRVNFDACLKVGAVSLVVAPLYNKSVAIGSLKILSDKPDAFAQRDVQTLELMAGLLGSAIAQQVHIQSNERLLAERTNALSALQTEMENRLRSEQQLRETQHRTRLILESSHDAFFSVDGDGIIVDWNDQSEALFGWVRQEAIGKQFAALLLPEAAHGMLPDEFDRVLRTSDATTINKRIELMAMDRFGKPLAVELSIYSISEGGAQIANVFVRNIGRHRQTKAGLESSRKVLCAIADKLPAWIAYIDEQERYRYANAYYFKESGINPDDMIGRTLKDVAGESRYAGMEDKVSEAMRGTEVHYEQTVAMEGGTVRQHVYYIPDIAGNGTVAGFYSIAIKTEKIALKESGS